VATLTFLVCILTVWGRQETTILTISQLAGPWTAMEVAVMTFLRCLALLHCYYHFKKVHRVGSSLIMKITLAYLLFTMFLYSLIVFGMMGPEFENVKESWFLIMLFTDIPKVTRLAQFALTSSHQRRIPDNLSVGMAQLGPVMTFETVGKVLLVGLCGLTNYTRLELLCNFALITVIVDYLTFMSFYPSGLSLVIELMFNKSGRPHWDVKQIIKMLPQEEVPNAVVYRIRVIAMTGLVVVHTFCRWPVDYSVTNSARNAQSISSEWSKLILANIEQFCILAVVLALAVKYLFYEDWEENSRIRKNYLEELERKFEEESESESVDTNTSERSTTLRDCVRPVADDMDRSSNSTDEGISLSTISQRRMSAANFERRRSSSSVVGGPERRLSSAGGPAGSKSSALASHRERVSIVVGGCDGIPYTTTPACWGEEEEEEEEEAAVVEYHNSKHNHRRGIHSSLSSSTPTPTPTPIQRKDAEMQTDEPPAILSPPASKRRLSDQDQADVEVEDDGDSTEDYERVVRDVAECVRILNSGGDDNSEDSGAANLIDEEIIQLVETKHIASHQLEKILNNPLRGVQVRRKILAEQSASTSGAGTRVSEALPSLPYRGYDYKPVMGACCENVIGYMPLPVGAVGPLNLDNRLVTVPMATTEGCLVASTNRGCRALKQCGVRTAVTYNGMTRGPVVRFPTMLRATEVMRWLDQRDNFDSVKAHFDSTSRFARLTQLQVRVAGRLLFIRFIARTGDAMGMNMLSKATEFSLRRMLEIFPDMEIISLSGNMCTDKKPAAVNWVNSRGKCVVAEAVVPASIVKTVLKTSTSALVDLNINKNLIGSSMAGSIGGFNAHAANIITAIYIATGQDAAQNVGSSNCMTLMEPWGADGEDLYITCTMPSIEVGTVGGGTVLPAQSACLEMLGVKGPHPTNPGENASTLARIVCGTVLAGELSLMSALAAGHLVRSHLRHNRSSAGPLSKQGEIPLNASSSSTNNSEISETSGSTPLAKSEESTNLMQVPCAPL